MHRLAVTLVQYSVVTDTATSDIFSPQRLSRGGSRRRQGGVSAPVTRLEPSVAGQKGNGARLMGVETAWNESVVRVMHMPNLHVVSFERGIESIP